MIEIVKSKGLGTFMSPAYEHFDFILMTEEERIDIFPIEYRRALSLGQD